MNFAEEAEKYRNELRVHCYRMLGSYDDAEEMVQETFLRAWRSREGFEGRSSVRAWLYRIATNACIDDVRRRVLPHQLEPASFPAEALPPREDVPWLQPFPDVLLDRSQEPDAVAVRRETIELAFLVAIQHLPPRQRAVLIFRDVLGWSARETAEAVELSVAAVNSALQRARPVLREHLPPHRTEWSACSSSAVEQELLKKYMAAWEAADPAALAALMHEDVRITMPRAAATPNASTPPTSTPPATPTAAPGASSPRTSTANPPWPPTSAPRVTPVTAPSASTSSAWNKASSPK